MDLGVDITCDWIAYIRVAVANGPVHHPLVGVGPRGWFKLLYYSRFATAWQPVEELGVPVVLVVCKGVRSESGVCGVLDEGARRFGPLGG